MTLLEYYSMPRPDGISQAELSRRCGLCPSQTSRFASGERPVPARYAHLIETALWPHVTRKDLLPDTWQLFWPDL